MFVFTLIGTAFVYGQNPVANFTADVTSGCAPLTVTFTDQSSGNPTSWNWEFSNGTLSNLQNPVVTFADPGTYSVRLVVQNANGIAQIERQGYINVFPSPTAGFTVNQNLGCVPTTIQFTSTSTTPVGTIVSWEWDFGDGGTSTQEHPSHTYNNEGFYTVTLTVTSSTGCRTTQSHSGIIRILGSIATDFSFNQPSTCRGPFTVNFNNQSSGPGNISYTWDFGNSQTSTAVNPSTVYTNPGTYTITLNAVSDLGCTGTIQKPITITTVATDFVAPANICLNQPVTFQNSSSSPVVNASWDFGDGTTSAQINPVKTFLTVGTYDIRLINEYASCTDSAFHTVTVTDRPVVNFTADDSTSCRAPFTVQFTDQSLGAVEWEWNFGDGSTSTLQNPSHTYASNGNYSVTLTITTAAGCKNTLVKPAYIRVQPTTVELNLPAEGCIPFTYTPVATVVTQDPVVSYSWDLGEPGAIFNVQNPPPYTYTSSGTFVVRLTVTTASGCTATNGFPNQVRTGVQPNVNFSFAPSNTCARDTIRFTDLSVTTPGALVTWFWDFGDGSESILQNPAHVYQDTGALTVRLIVSNNGCRDTLDQPIQVIPPVARFYYDVNCLTGLVTFRDTSLIDPGINPISWSWDFGNGTFSSAQHPPPVNYAPGTYTVTLTVTNGPCSYQTTQEVIIANEPANFTASRNPVCKNETFTLSAINSDNANIATYLWIINDDTLANNRTVDYSIANTGNYDVTLQLTDRNGCISRTTIPNFITVNGPVANFTPVTPTCLNKPVTFSDLSTPAASIRTWEFDFGDGTQQSFSSAPFAHTYSDVGGYIVSLTVTDAAGCKDTYTSPMDMLVTNPIAGFRADTFYCPLSPLQFADSSSGAGLSYQWTFGDGNNSTLQNPQNTYPLGDADYTVTLIVTDVSGCTDTASKPQYIKIRSPKPAFEISDTATICPPFRTNFTFQGQDYESFYWAFGDGGLSTLQNPSYFYATYGDYVAKLYLTGPGGCIDSAEANVHVYNPNLSQVNYGPDTRACNSLNVDFDLVVPPGFKFLFHFGDGSIDSTQRTSFSHFYSRPSFNTPVLVILDTSSGCAASIVGTPRIDVLGAVPLFGKDKEEFCDNGLVVFTDFTTKNEPIINTLWQFGDGGTSSAQSPTYQYTQPGMQIVTLTITTESDCTSSYRDTVFVYRTPVPSIVSRDTICLDVAEPINGIIAVPDTLTFWQWNFGNGQTSTQPNNTVTYTDTGNHTLQLITANKLDCRDTTTKVINVVPRPTATPVQDPITLIVGASTPLPMNYTGNIISYNWTPTTRLSCTDCPEPVANPVANTTYTVQLEDVYGCRNSGEITVLVVCGKENFFIPNTFSPNGDGHNETFFPRGTGLYNIKSMLVFNRWGQVVFERKNFPVNNPSVGWDGTFNGKKASADVYVYMIELLCENNVSIPIKGNVTLLR